MDLFTVNEAPNVELVGIGGTFRKLTLSFVGPQAVRSIAAHFADKVFFSIKGLTPDGYLTDPDPLEAEVKRSMIEHAEKPVLLVDGTKFEQRGLTVITHISRLSLALVADAPADRVEALSRAGIEVRHV
jgi:DeoR/GlpR family transcriptional regulator of sugar metabolism